MNNRYLEIDSTYRDRSKFPKPGYFEIPISQSGRRSSLLDSYDPVSLGVPKFAWTSNNLSTSAPASASLLCTVEAKTLPLAGTIDTGTFIINSTDRLQEADDYYSGLIIEDAAFFNRRRIKSYKFLGSYNTYDRAEITVDSSFPETFVPTNQIYIFDCTDLTNPEYPLFFVPMTSHVHENGFVSYVMYNETLNEYRPIKNFDKKIHCVLLDTENGSNPVSGWDVNHNYSIRKDKPFYPIIGADNPIIIYSADNAIQIDYDIGIGNNQKFVRVLPSTYNYKLTGADNECRRIVNYDSSTQVLTVFPPFSEPPIPKSQIEILNYSHDNLCPFVYTGSVLSQQELVCYEIDLLSLILPTETLRVSEGGLITYYEYVYVELSNTCSGGHKNIIYSNNPNSTRMLFRVPLFDIQDPPHRIKVGGGMTQTIKFKPNDTLLFTVTMPNGEVFDTIVPEKFTPSEPESRIQISAVFSLRRLA